ncbi:MAG: CvpA family protein [Clostridia bacterium]|nr:CvpA family protein [Clostridia bacterium]MBQ1376034.1 CvpA family protein [Clostridia bacterium]MBQ1434388.1 CvpA family protein [Clostridia bacterium]MBQ4249438.1 CvpA family protein [Clostridia bacterium]
MSIALDIITAVIFLWAVIASWRKGFVKAFLGFAAIIVAFVVTKMYYESVAAWIDEKFMHSRVVAMLDNMVASNEQISTARAAFDQFIANVKSIVPQLTPNTTSFGGTDPLQNTMDAITSRISFTFSEVAAIIVVFLAVLLVCRIIIAIIDAIFKLPGLGVINHGLGLILGIVKGTLFVFLFCLLVSFIGMMMSASPDPAINREMINETYIFKIFYYNNVIANGFF